MAGQETEYKELWLKGIAETSGNLFQVTETELFEELRGEGALEMAAKVGVYAEEICRAEKAEGDGL